MHRLDIVCRRWTWCFILSNGSQNRALPDGDPTTFTYGRPPRPGCRHQLRLENYLVDTEPMGRRREKSQRTSLNSVIAPLDMK